MAVSQQPRRQALSENSNEQTRQAIVTCFFGTNGDPWTPDLDAYFDYYHRELRRLRVGVVLVLSTLAAKSHHDLLDICRVLSANRLRSRADIRAELCTHFATKDHQAVDRSVDLTIRLWLMINVRDGGYGSRVPAQPELVWEDCCSLESFVAGQFRPSMTQLGFRESRLDSEITVARMVRICGLKVRWTESLNDHLRLDRRRKVLSVFPYKDFLVAHLHMTTEERTKDVGSEKKSHDPEQKLFSPALLSEAILTLNLLFPQWDPLTQNLLLEHGQTFASEPPFHVFAGSSFPSLDEFVFWRNRILELQEEIYNAPPGTWAQMWVDRRRPLEWGTFWIALLVLILTVLNFVPGIVQAVASVKSVRLAEQQLAMSPG